MIIHIYTRASDDQSTMLQINACRTYLQEHTLLDQPQILYTDSCTGNVPFEDRIEGGKLIARIKPGDRVLVTSPCRFSRNLDEYARIVNQIVGRGVEVVVIHPAAPMPVSLGELMAATAAACERNERRLELFPELVAALKVAEAFMSQDRADDYFNPSDADLTIVQDALAKAESL